MYILKYHVDGKLISLNIMLIISKYVDCYIQNSALPATPHYLVTSLHDTADEAREITCRCAARLRPGTCISISIIVKLLCAPLPEIAPAKELSVDI